MRVNDSLAAIPPGWYHGTVKVKTSITLSDSVLKKLERYAKAGDRSEFIERAIWRYFDDLQRRARDVRDARILGERAGSLNAEALDALSFQILP
jgi:predicted transcriptional regulator